MYCTYVPYCTSLSALAGANRVLIRHNDAATGGYWGLATEPAQMYVCVLYQPRFSGANPHHIMRELGSSFDICLQFAVTFTGSLVLRRHSPARLLAEVTHPAELRNTMTSLLIQPVATIENPHTHSSHLIAH